LTEAGEVLSSGPLSAGRRIGWALAAFGAAAALAAAVLDPGGARGSVSQDWSPFVLVAGLLLIGLVADDDGLFEAAGSRLAGLVSSDFALFAWAVVLISAVTAVLNLDTSVAFLTPVFVHVARARRSSEAPLLYGCLMLSNAASLLLPGANLTNLIVLGHLHLSGSRFAGRMALPFLAAVAVTAVLVAFAHRKELAVHPLGVRARSTSAPTEACTPLGARADGRPPLLRPHLAHPPIKALGSASVLAAAVAVLLLRSPALPVAAVGSCAAAVKLSRRRTDIGEIVHVLGPQILLGLFGVAVALGTLGRSWSGPAILLTHLDSWATAGIAAVASVLANNLPAASLLASRVPPHPYALLVGLNLGPNLFVTGSLSSLLWINGARRAGARPSVGHVARLGVVVVPMSMAGALAVLGATGAH